MANQFRIDVEGEKELMTKLRALSKPFRRQALLHAVEQGGEVIKREAQARAPLKTGRLQKSISVVPERQQSWRSEVGISWKVGKAPSAAFYGLFAELGTKPRERKSGAPTGTARPTPFLGPAFKAKQGEANLKIRVAISRLLRKAAKRGIT